MRVLRKSPFIKKGIGLSSLTVYHNKTKKSIESEKKICQGQKKEQFSSDDYERGYYAGLNENFERTNLDAYFAGVGYGKKNAKDKYLGFNSADEREQFEHGIRQKDKHFNAHRAEPLSWWERLFGVKRNRHDDIKIVDRRGEARQKVKRASKKTALKPKRRRK